LVQGGIHYEKIARLAKKQTPKSLDRPKSRETKHHKCVKQGNLKKENVEKTVYEGLERLRKASNKRAYGDINKTPYEKHPQRLFGGKQTFSRK